MNKISLIVGLVVLCGCASTPKTPKIHVISEPVVNFVHDPYLSDEVTATDLSFDTNTGEIKYTLPKPALVRLRIGFINNGPLVRSLMEWQPREAGPHVEKWDMKDPSGQVDYKGNPNLMAVLHCVSQDAPAKASGDFRRTFRNSPKFSIEFPEAVKDHDGNLHVKDKTPLRVLIDAADREWLVRTRHEIGLYIDNNFIIEDEEASNPFTYQFDAGRFNEGRHVITVNVIVYTGEVGAQSVPIVIDHEKHL